MSTSTLTQVLEAIEENSGPLSLNQLADQLNISRGMIEDMLQFWVRKGRLRIVDSQAEANCSHCAVKAGCSLIAKIPKRYEIIDEDMPNAESADKGYCCTPTKPGTVR